MRDDCEACLNSKDEDGLCGEHAPCPTCGGEGYGVEGEDWKMDDPINGPWDADEDGISPCPNCRGSGKWKDARYF